MILDPDFIELPNQLLLTILDQDSLYLQVLNIQVFCCFQAVLQRNEWIRLKFGCCGGQVLPNVIQWVCRS